MIEVKNLTKYYKGQPWSSGKRRFSYCHAGRDHRTFRA